MSAREFELLAGVFRANPALPASVTIPPGDDMGALRLDGRDVLVAVDQVADGVHLDAHAAGPERVARKALTRNLSDVAAMAARPVGAVVAACLPRSFDADWAHALTRALQTIGAAYGCPVFGGDVSFWDHPLLLSVTVLAEPAGIDPVLRRGAEVGDAVWVTGELGGSLEDIAGRIHHLDFEPRLGPARALAANPATRPHCMIDLSDGLGRDLAHLCRAGGVAAEIDADCLPISAAAEQAAARSGRPVWQHAVGDGEDYELLFCAPDSAIPASIDGVPITRIGHIVRAEPGAEPGVSVRLTGGETVPAAGLGWEHGG